MSGAGAIVGGIPGAIVGGISGGGGLSNTLGVQNNYQASNPYGQQQLQYEVNEQGDVYNQQQQLAQALQAQMNGQGPNPAQLMYQQNAQNNAAQAQGLIASQRGLNPALAAKMGANSVAQNNQQASLGSALLQQQQQLAATQSLGNIYGQMQQGNLGYQKLYDQSNLGAQQLNANINEGNTNRNAQLIGGLMNAGGGAAAAMAAHGGRIPGNASVSGDSTQNDTVPTMLSPGEIVIPRSVSHDPEKAKEFVDHILKSEGKGSDEGYGKVLKAKRKLQKTKGKGNE